MALEFGEVCEEAVCAVGGGGGGGRQQTTPRTRAVMTSPSSSDASGAPILFAFFPGAANTYALAAAAPADSDASTMSAAPSTATFVAASHEF